VKSTCKDIFYFISAGKSTFLNGLRCEKYISDFISVSYSLMQVLVKKLNALHNIR
jgi:hypothetical protein